MKSLIAALLVPIAITTIHAQPSLPPVVIAGNEPVNSKEFSAWIEQDPTKYSGSYSGEPGGDTGATFTINVTKHVTKNVIQTVPFVASGTCNRKTSGCIPQVVDFKDAHYYNDSKGVFDAGAFKIIFVKYGKRHGAIIGDCFFDKRP